MSALENHKKRHDMQTFVRSIQESQGIPAASFSSGNNLLYPSFVGVKAVIFEFENVVFDGTAWQRRCCQWLERLGRNISFALFCSQWRKEIRLHRSVHMSSEEILERCLRRWEIPTGLATELVAACRALWRKASVVDKPFTSVVTLIQSLYEKSMRLGLVSDSLVTVSDMQERLNAWHIGNCFSTISSRRDSIDEQSDVAWLIKNAKNLTNDVDTVAFVGREEEQLTAAMRAGLKPFGIHCNPDGRLLTTMEEQRHSVRAVA